MNLNQEIINAVEQWQEHLSHPSSDFTKSFAAIEEAALALGQRIAQLAVSHQIEQIGTGYSRSTRPCSCGAKQRFERYCEKTVRTLFGELTYKRAYYRCRRCRASCFPIDQLLQQSEREISPALERNLALLSAHLSFAESERVLKQIAGVEVSARQIENVAESIGSEAEQKQQKEDQQAAFCGLESRSGPLQPEERIFIIEMDGVQLGFQAGGWQEVKCAVIYELSQRVEINEGRWELIDKHKCVLRGDVGAFRRRVWALCLRAGIRETDRIVVIGDGAEWIDQSVELMFEGATRILDFYHASERVWTVAFARWGEGSEQAIRWAEEKLSQMKEGKIKEVIESINRLRMKGEEGERIRRVAVNYLKARREQMKYDEYKKLRLPIGSGAVESTCKQMVTARCKQAGMRWSEEGADAILALRSYVLNDRFDELCPKPLFSLEWKKVA